jgi:hypothetical protein
LDEKEEEFDTTLQAANKKKNRHVLTTKEMNR